MKRCISRKASAVFCIVSLLLTICMTGCGKTQNENSSEKSSPSINSSEISEPSGSSEESSKVSTGNFTYSENGNGNITLTKYNGKETSPELPSVIDGKTVAAVGESCFAGNTYVLLGAVAG